MTQQHPRECGTVSLTSEERAIVAWLRSHQDQHERAIAAGQCARFSTMHGELRDQAAYYCEAAERIERGEHQPRPSDEGRG